MIVKDVFIDPFKHLSGNPLAMVDCSHPDIYNLRVKRYERGSGGGVSVGYVRHLRGLAGFHFLNSRHAGIALDVSSYVYRRWLPVQP